MGRIGFHFDVSVDRLQAVAVEFLLVGRVPVDTRNSLVKQGTFAGQRPGDRLKYWLDTQHESKQKMNIDHIFIFTEDKGQVADQLVDFGLAEGSSRIHVGQGTANRKFYFANFFLEVLWIYNEAEVNSELIVESGLWNRANFRDTHFSRFGLCLVNDETTERLFDKASKYQPFYFPEGLAIDVLQNNNNPKLPWTFRLPFKEQKKNETEPTEHGNGIHSLTKSIFEYESVVSEDSLEYFKNENRLEFKNSSRNWLTLIFDEEVRGRSFDFESLSLTIRY